MAMEKKATGRPSSYTDELAEEICETIASSGRGIKNLCRTYEHWPSHDTIYKWLKKHKNFADLYAKAKRHQVEIILDEILDISDDTSNDTITRIDKDGNEQEICNTEWINRSRLRVDTRKWLAAKLCPRLYGDRHEHVKLKFPDDISKRGALLEMSSEVFRALTKQEIDIDQAKSLISSIKDHGINITLGDLSDRLNKLEEGSTDEKK